MILKGAMQMLESNFLSECYKQTFWKKNDRLLLAVSTGVDSMVLLDLIMKLPLKVKPWFAVAHVNHQLRNESQNEAAFLEAFCLDNGIPYFSTKWEKSEQPKTGTEAAARTFRYEFFKKIMAEEKISHLVTAHHGDDQAETILMRLVRGGHLESIAGIQTDREFYHKQLVRPLLAFTKGQLLEYSKNHQVFYFEDKTNLDDGYTRNRYRNHILPLLKKENPQVIQHFNDFSNDLQEILEIAQLQIMTSYQKVVKQESKGTWKLTISDFQQYPSSLRKQILNHFLQELLKQTTFSYQRNHLAKILELIESQQPNGELHFSNQWYGIKSYDSFYVTNEKIISKSSFYSTELPLNSWVDLPNGERVGFFKTTDYKEKETPNQLVIYLNPASLELPLTIRNRLPGDKMSLKGKSRGHKKLKDILIDQKIPLEQRNQAYLIADNQKKIIWLIEYKESQLSIAKETDKIQYILVYDKNEGIEKEKTINAK